MWAALEAHEPKRGYAKAWPTMLKERTANAAADAGRAAEFAGFFSAMSAAYSTAWAVRYAQRAIDALRGGEAVSKVDEMWAAFERYQPRADASGHGDSWRVMCRERTEDAVWAAWKTAGGVADIAQYSNYEDAADAAHDAALAAAIALRVENERDAELYAAIAINNISQAMEVKP
jgi:hypothetical protein